jgi:S-adenosylmethionine:tRNA ribosyltransferase-isomerase
MNISEFYFELPEELIAQEPLADRAGSRMMVVRRAGSTTDDRMFVDFPSFIRPGDVVVLNNTRVFPARLYGTSETGAKVELLLLEQSAADTWSALAKPARRFKPGHTIIFTPALSAEIVENAGAGQVMLRFKSTTGELDDALESAGRTPLPHYIHRDAAPSAGDRDRYQTIYAKQKGAVAAPTAGLHFTPEILEAVSERGAQIVEVTLHVGYGTFEPVRVTETSEHKVAGERYEISESAAATLNAAMTDRRRVVAVGTTTTRALESAYAEYGEFRPGWSIANLTVVPGYEFRVVGAMLTNFHLPQSSLLILTSTFGGHELIMKAYAKAVELRYRFYSYGDCMLII